MKSPEGNQGSPEEIEEAEGRMTSEEARSSESREKKLKHEILLKEAVSDLYNELLFKGNGPRLAFLELVAEKMIEELGEIYVSTTKDTDSSGMRLWAEEPKRDGAGHFDSGSQQDISLGVGHGQGEIRALDWAISELKKKFELISEEKVHTSYSSIDSRLYHFKKKIEEATGVDTA